MDQYTQGRMASQVRRVRQCRRQVVQEQDLCFTKLLPQEQIEAALERHQVRYRERRYTPLVTIWTFLYQVLSSDQSCRAAVARLLAFLCVGKRRGAVPRPTPIARPGSVCPRSCWPTWPATAARQLQQEVPAPNLLGGRPLKIADGTTLSMPDTPANQKAYPQQRGQKPGLGFPILRLVGLISLSCGAVLDVATGPYRGKRTGETALLRQLLDSSARPGTSCWPMLSSPTTGPSPCCSNGAWISSVGSTAGGGWISVGANGWAGTITSSPGPNRTGRRG